jgi:hypothetical protein
MHLRVRRSEAPAILLLAAFCLFVGHPRLMRAFQQPTFARSVTILGVVASSGMDSKPLPGVQLSLKTTAGTPVSSAVTDSAGRFRLTAPHGRYQVVPILKGFVFSASEHLGTQGMQGLWIEVPNQPETIHLRMAKAAVVTGQVVFTGNQKSVVAYLVQPSFDTYGKRGFGLGPQIPGARAAINDRGEYRFFDVPPAEYYLRFPTGGLGMLYFPGTTDPEKALPFRVAAGEELRLSPVVFGREALFEVRLRSSDPNAEIPTELSARLFSGGSEATIAGSLGRGNQIVLPGVQPRRYEILATWSTSPVAMSYVRATVDVQDRDIVQEVSIQQTPLLTGTIVLDEGGTQRRTIPGLRCTLRSDFPPTSLSWNSNCVGGKAIPGLYRLDLAGMPPDVYVAKASASGADILADGLNLVGPTEVDILLRTPGAIAEGVVRDARGMRVSGTTVSLVPSDPFRKAWVLYRNGVTDVNGKFELRGIAPGTYKLFAWSHLDGGADRNEEFMKTHSAKGVVVRFEQPTRRTIDLLLADEK